MKRNSRLVDDKATKKRHTILILVGFIPLAVVILLFVLALALFVYDFAWGWLVRLGH
ncbi:MAG: hypothetical protein WCB27_23655 [Thermoguttaceae bacterium]